MRVNKQTLQRTIYILVLAAIAAFLYWLGAKPWLHMLHHWAISLIIMGITGLGIVVQTLSYESVVPSASAAQAPRRLELLRIWSLSGAVSVAVPVFAGFGTRTTLLVKNGMPLTATLLTSARQAWMGLEYALLLGGVAALFIDFAGKVWLAFGLLMGWMCMVVFRIYAGKAQLSWQSKIGRLLEALSSPIAVAAHKWFLLQVILMGMIYFVAFHGLGASVSWAAALLLATVTVFASLVVLVPNGLGVMDAIWVVVGTQADLQLAQSVAFALILRLSYLASAALVWISVSAFLRANAGRHE